MYIGNCIEDLHGTAFPATPFVRQWFFRDDLLQWFYWDGLAWVLPGGLVPHHLTHELGGADQVMGTVPATPLALVHRDAAGRSQIANPAVNADIDNMGSRVAGDAAEAAARAAAIEAHRTGAVHVLGQPPQGHHASHEPGGVDAMAVNAAAGTGSLRTLAGTGAALSAARSDHTHTLVDDVSGAQAPANVASAALAARQLTQNIAAGGNSVSYSVTLNFAATSRAVGSAMAHGNAGGFGGDLKLQLIMGGVLVAESAFIGMFDGFYVLVALRALSGAQTVSARIHNYNLGGAVGFLTYSVTGGINQTSRGYGVAVGSVTI